MAIVIKDMEMPKSCRECQFMMNCDACEGWECVCVPLHTQIGYYDDILPNKRRDDCPLFEIITIPELHVLNFNKKEVNMSVLIKDMEMPRNCADCNCWSVCWDNRPAYNMCKSVCPLIFVPPHGRLIDADALNYTMRYKENWMNGTGVEVPGVWKSDIDNAPTVIPASEEAEK